MFDSMSMRDQRAFAVGLFIALVIACIWILGLPSYVSWKINADQVDDLRFQIRRYQNALTEKPTLLKRRENLLTGREKLDLFYQAQTTGVVAANIQNRLQQLADEADIGLTSTQVLSDQDEGVFKRVAISARFEGADQSLHALLAALERARPLLMIDKMVVASRRQPGSRSADSQSLRITLEVVAYMTPGVLN